MERWGQLLYVKGEAFADQTSAVFGQVSKELKALELIWGEKLFPDGSIEGEFREKSDGSQVRNGSAGYPTKEALGRIFEAQVGRVEGRVRKQKNFVNLLVNAGLRARMPIPAGELQGRMRGFAGAMSLLMHAYLLRLPRVKEIRAKLPLDRTELEALVARHGQSKKHRRAGGQASNPLSEEEKKSFQLVDNMHSALNELNAVEKLLQALIGVVKDNAERAADVVVDLGGSFNPCDICKVEDIGVARFGLVRSFCGHSMCVKCFGNCVLSEVNGYRPQSCPYARCEAFQAVEVDLFVAFQGQYSDPRMWMPPVARVSFDRLAREGLFEKEQESDVKQWNTDLQSARQRVLAALAGGDKTLAACGDDVAALRRPGAGGLRVLDAVALTCQGWVSWIRGDKERAVEELESAVGQLNEAVEEAVAAGLHAPQTVGEYLGKTRCALGMRHFMGRGQGDSLQRARQCFDSALEAMVRHGCVAGQGHVHGHLGVWFYTMGALEDAGSRMDAEEATRAALDAYKRQLQCYEACEHDQFTRVPGFVVNAVKLNIGLLEIRARNYEGVHAALPESYMALFEPHLTELANDHVESILNEAQEIMQAPEPHHHATVYPVQQVAAVTGDFLDAGHGALESALGGLDVHAFGVHDEEP